MKQALLKWVLFDPTKKFKNDLQNSDWVSKNCSDLMPLNWEVFPLYHCVSKKTSFLVLDSDARTFQGLYSECVIYLLP